MRERTLGRPTSPRRRNLASVLHLIHREAPLTRADITARTGLNRSTVAALIGELEALGLATETAPDRLGRVGRPSPVVRPGESPVALTVHPEVDAVTLGIVGLGARVDQRVRIAVPSPPTPEQTAAIVEDFLSDGGRADLRLIGAGIAVPGLVRRDGTVAWAPHLGWKDAPLATLITAATGLAATAANDAALGAAAEFWFGAGRGSSDLIHLNGGASGIGGGIILDGRPVAGHHGFAGELGHTRPGGAGEDRVTAHGVLEDEVHRDRVLRILGLTDADEPELADAIDRSADDRVHAEVDRQRRVLAAALVDAVNALDPEVVVLGGHLATLLASDPAGLASLVADRALAPTALDLRLVPAALGPERLLIGAAELAFAALLGDPAAHAP